MTQEEIRFKLSQKTQPILLLGAGASIESGGRTANSIATELLGYLYEDASEATLKNRFLEEHNRPATFENVLDILGASGSERRDLLIMFFKKMAPSKGYKYLAALLKAGYFYPIIFSMNFDTLLEQAVISDKFVSSTKKLRVLVQEDISDNMPSFGSDDLVLVKLHGDIEQPHSLKITRSETAALTSSASKLLEQLLVSQGLISVGYRAGDYDIIHALFRIGKSKKTVFWTTIEDPDPQQDSNLIQFLKNQGNSAKLLTNSPFDDFFTYLGSPLVETRIRQKHGEYLEKCWECLHEARGYTKQRGRALREMNEILSVNLEEVNIRERDALKELLSYEINGRRDVYRLRKAVEHLQDALREQKGYLDETECFNLTYRLIEELLNLFLAGDNIPDKRFKHLQLAEDLAKGMDSLANTDSLKAKRFVLLGELLKEEAMLTRDRVGQLKLFGESRQNLSEAITLLSNADGSKEKYYLATAHRHIGVTYELEGDMSKSSVERKVCYNKWRQHSEKARYILRSLKEDSVYFYATMNLASSLTRLAAREMNFEQKKQLLDHGYNLLENILKPLEKLEDHLGLGWTHIHMCDNLRAQAIEATEVANRLSLLSDVEVHANCALAELRQTLDTLATGLAYYHLVSRH